MWRVFTIPSKTILDPRTQHVLTVITIDDGLEEDVQCTFVYDLTKKRLFINIHRIHIYIRKPGNYLYVVHFVQK